MIGNILSARYELIERFGESLLFDSYRARDLTQGRSVTIKILKHSYGQNTRVVESLKQLYATLTSLRHPNVVTVYGFDEDGGEWFLIEEFVRGLDLKTRIQRTAPFTVPIAIEIAIGIAEALEAAHRAGVIHGDLHPQEVIVGTDWHVWVNGFGLHSVYRVEPTLAAAHEARSVYYTAPEVLEGNLPGVSSDLYGFGVVLFEMLTGSLPYMGETPLLVAKEHLQRPIPSPRSLNPAVPRTVEGIVLKCLQKEPDRRYSRMTDLLHDLKAVRDSLRFGKPLSWSPLETAEPQGTTSIPPMIAITDELEEDEVPGWLRFINRALLVIVLLGILVGTGLWLSFTMAPDERPIPKLVGKTLTEAQRIAGESGFQLEIKRQDYNETYPPGAIYFVNPPEGRQAKKGTIIEVWVSQGSRYVKLPDVRNLPESEARTRLEGEGFVVADETVDKYHELVPLGYVITTDPPPETRIERSKPIKLVVSKGYPSLEPEGQSPPTEEPAPSAGSEPRLFVTKIYLPGEGEQRVRIEVEDALGKRNVLDEMKIGGMTHEFDVEGYGDKVIIRVYVDERLVKEIQK